MILSDPYCSLQHILYKYSRFVVALLVVLLRFLSQIGYYTEIHTRHSNSLNVEI